MENYNTINEVLVHLFREINHIEESSIITEEFRDITNNDMHVIEAIGTTEMKNMSSVAKTLSVTVGTLTIAINHLVKKGYVDRERSEIDRRVVMVDLTEKGRRAFEHHKKFHEEMVKSTLEGLNEEETEILVQALKNLLKFFHTRR